METKHLILFYRSLNYIYFNRTGQFFKNDEIVARVMRNWDDLGYEMHVTSKTLTVDEFIASYHLPGYHYHVVFKDEHDAALFKLTHADDIAKCLKLSQIYDN